MKWKTACRSKRASKSSAGSLDTRLPQTCIAGSSVRRAGPSPLDGVIHADANAAWSEGEIYYAYVGDSSQGQQRAAEGPSAEAIDSQLQRAVSVIQDFYTFHDVDSFSLEGLEMP